MKRIIQVLSVILAVGLVIALFIGLSSVLFNSNSTTPTTSFSRPGYWNDQILQTSSTRPTGNGDSLDIPTVPSKPSTKPTTKPTTRPTQVTTRPSTSPSTLPPLPPVTTPGGAASKLSYTQYGRFSGLYMEDGKDEYVSGVAALYVTNTSDEYLEYASILCDINGKDATFVVTGLKPGSSAWILEKNRLVIEDADINDVILTHKSDQSSFLADNSEEALDVIVTMQNAQISAYNNTGRDLKSVYVYYKKQFTSGGEPQNGIYMGGITYRVLLGDIPNGQTAQAIAGHCTPKGCEVVRITWE